MEQCLLLCARRYDFQDPQGKRVEGATLVYLTGDVSSEPDRRGMEPMTISGPAELFPEISAIPGVYEMDFKQRPGPKGRPTLQVVALRFLRAVNLASGAALEREAA